MHEITKGYRDDDWSIRITTSPYMQLTALLKYLTILIGAHYK